MIRLDTGITNGPTPVSVGGTNDRLWSPKSGQLHALQPILDAKTPTWQVVAGIPTGGIDYHQTL